MPRVSLEHMHMLLVADLQLRCFQKKVTSNSHLEEVKNSFC